jgi:hypothetical protein
MAMKKERHRPAAAMHGLLLLLAACCERAGAAFRARLNPLAALGF